MKRSVVVTGCGSGIGRAVVERLVVEGYYVVGVERDEGSGSALIEKLGEGGAVVISDVRDRDALEGAAKLASAGGLLSGWVNNVGVALGGSLLKADPGDVEALVQINLMSHFWGSRVAVKAFLAQGNGGSIVNMSSIHGRAAFNGWAAYDMAKGGIDALTRYIAVEYGPVGIRANAIAPGAIRTEMLADVINRSANPEREEHDMASLHPLERLGEPSEVASVVVFLLSDESSFVSGQSLAVDGGATARCYRYETDPDLLSQFGVAKV